MSAAKTLKSFYLTNSASQLVQFSSVSQLYLILCDSMDYSTPGLPVHHQFPQLAQTRVHQVGDATQPSHPLSSPSPPAFNLFQHQGLFQWVSSSQGWSQYWSFSFSISPSNEYSGLISFRIDWLDLLAVHGTLKSLLQYHSSKASVIQYSAFFMAQLSHPHMNTGKTTALTRQTIVVCLSLFPLFPHLFAMKWWDWMPWSSFLDYFFTSSFDYFITRNNTYVTWRFLQQNLTVAISCM